MRLDSEIVVRVQTRGGRIEQARVRAQRPRLARNLLAGRPAAEASAFVGALFAICACAQSAAAEAATDAALGRETRFPAARGRSLAAELVQEHLWQLLIDWPRLAGESAQAASLAEARALAAALAAAPDTDAEQHARTLVEWVADRIFGEAPAQFLERGDLAALDGWVHAAKTPVAALVGRVLSRHAALGASATPLLETGSDALALELAAALEADAGFEAAPHRHGEARETGVLARNVAHPMVGAAIALWGRGVGARTLARLVDLAAGLEAIESGRSPRCGAARLGESSGVAWVETARGLLVHVARVEGARLAAYRIVAPTEWNFHPDGAMARGALGFEAGNDGQIEERLRWLVASLDPCAAWRLELGHA